MFGVFDKTEKSEGIKVATNSSSETKENETSLKTSANPPDHTKLPLGDDKYSTSPKKGFIYSCQTTFNGGGAFTTGPWVDKNAKTWDFSKKVFVDGEVSWTPSITNTINGEERIIKSNGLPNHKTGTYPISKNDDAYSYDRNPNSIRSQNLSYTLPVNPTLSGSPGCVGGEVGIMLSGIPLFNGFDAGGRDAVAWEVQDKCGGHPQELGQYHYHGFSSCIVDDSKEGEHSSLAGYAFDGFGIFGIKGEKGVELSSNALDECHGHTHEISWDGKKVAMYHYHLTYDFPYSIACFRAPKQVQGPSSGQSGQTNSSKLPPPQNGQPPPK